MVNSNTAQVSIAKMKSPQGWEEPGQTPEFDEYTIVLDGTLRVKTKATDIKKSRKVRRLRFQKEGDYA